MNEAESKMLADLIDRVRKLENQVQSYEPAIMSIDRGIAILSCVLNAIKDLLINKGIINNEELEKKVTENVQLFIESNREPKGSQDGGTPAPAPEAKA